MRHKMYMLYRKWVSLKHKVGVHTNYKINDGRQICYCGLWRDEQ